MAAANQERIRCALIRGGTSRGVFLLGRDLPRDPKRREEALLAMLGRLGLSQVDGLGGGVPWTSVVVLLDQSKRAKTDVEVTFGRLLPDSSGFDYSTVSGDLVSAAAQFAVDEGLVKAARPKTPVRMVDVATGQSMMAEIPVKDGLAQMEGQCLVAGIAGRGACIKMSFPDLGQLPMEVLPTGHMREGIATTFGEYVVSMVNALTPVVFVNAAALGLQGTELPRQLELDSDLRDRVGAIRRHAAEAMGFASSAQDAPTESPVKPRVVTVFEAMEYDDRDGRHIGVVDTDLVCREFSLGVLHPAFDTEVAVCTAVAAQMQGTVVFDALLREVSPRVARIGHPSGVISVELDIDQRDGHHVIRNAIVETTARRIMDGHAYVPRNHAR